MKIRWGIIGCGDIARNRVAAAIQQDPNSQLLAACCRTADDLSSFCDQFEIGRAYSSHTELLNDPDVDAVYLATPVDFHEPHTIQAASKKKSGGGAVMDIGSHRIDLMLDLFGNVRNVEAVCDTRMGAWEAEDCATVLCQFESGVQATIQCFFRTRVPIDSFEITGSHGRVLIKSLNGPKIEWQTEEVTHVDSLPPDENLHAPLIRDFSLALAENRPPRCTGLDGLRTNQIIARAYQSANARRSIG